MIKTFTNQFQFLFIWTKGLVDKVNHLFPVQISAKSSSMTNPLLDHDDQEALESPRKNSSKISRDVIPLTRNYQISFDLIKQSKLFFFHLFKALKLIPLPGKGPNSLNEQMQVIDALKYHTFKYGLVDNKGLFPQLYKEYGQKNTGWTILKILFLILFLQEHPPHQLNDLSIFGLNAIIQSNVVSFLPEPKGPECVQQQPIEIYQKAIGTLNDALWLLGIDKQVLNNQKFLSQDHSAERLTDSEFHDQDEPEPLTPVRRRESKLEKKYNRGIEACSLDTRATSTRYNGSSLFFPGFEESTDLNKSKVLRIELEKHRKRNRAAQFELDDLKGENEALSKEIKLLQDQILKKEQLSEQQRIDLLEECHRRDEEIRKREIECAQLMGSIEQLEIRLEEQEQLSPPPSRDNQNQLIPLSLYEDLQFQLKSAKEESEHYEKKWIEALQRIKNLSGLQNTPLLPYSSVTHQPLFSSIQAARYLEPYMEEDGLSHTQSVLASQEMHARIACSKLTEKVEMLEAKLKKKNELLQELGTKYAAKKQYSERVMALSKNYEKLYKIYLNKSQHYVMKENNRCCSPFPWALVLYPLVALLFSLLVFTL